jgi:hypothetical protein
MMLLFYFLKNPLSELFLKGLVFILVVSFYSCASHKIVSYDPKKLGIDDDCQPSKTTYYYDSLLTPQSLQSQIADSATIERFSLRARNIAVSAGAMRALNEFTRLEPKAKAGSESAKLALLYVRQEIDERLSLAVLDISSVLAEIECEKDRASQLRNHLLLVINKRVKILNIGSIFVGALATVVSSGVSLIRPNDNVLIQEVSIIGATFGGYLALRQIFVQRKGYFAHPRNHLRDIWLNSSKPLTFPPNVWHFLTKQFTIDGKQFTGRELLIRQFIEIGALDLPNKKDKTNRVSLFFSDGGEYSVSHLSDRINMLELLETEINLMKYDLKRLHQEILIGNSK